MFKKRYLSNDETCKVIFTLPPQIDAMSAVLVGDFNRWDKDATPMKRAKDGTWQAEVRLEVGREYQYRYLVNGNEWHNDPAADRFSIHPYGGENSVIQT